MAARNPIVQRRVAVVNDWGLHARPCAAIVAVAAKHNCEIEIIKGKQRASANSVAELLMLEAHNGSDLQVTARGPKANQALQEISAIITGGFGERHLIIQGTGDESGIAVGRARILTQDHRDIPHFNIAKTSIAAEKKRLEEAREQVREQFNKLASSDQPDAEISQFQQLLLAMLDDSIFSIQPFKLIDSEQVNAEWAVKLATEPILDALRNSSDELIRTRSSDYSQVMMRIIAQLDQTKASGRRRRRGTNHIQIAGELGPADVIEAMRAGYKGLVMADGSSTSHATILSHSLGLPAIVGIGKTGLSQIQENDLLVIDSDKDQVHVNPPEEVLMEYRKLARKQALSRKQETSRRHKPPARTVTRDGHRIHLYANLEVAEEIPNARLEGAEGIGLFRTESIFLEKDELPDEEAQYQIYRQVLTAMEGLPVTFRTLDLGYDKNIGQMSTSVSAMGVRGIRYCLHETSLFKTQLRALLRASSSGNMSIMLPMVGSVDEMTATRSLLAEARHELGLDDMPLPPLGAMIEIPATVSLLADLAQVTDFFSIGSNDLVSYLLAIDRREAQLANSRNSCHPAVIASLVEIITSANATGTPVTLCGELAGDIRFARLLSESGLRSLSLAPDRLRHIHKMLVKTNLSKLRTVARQTLKASSQDKIVKLLESMA